ncbi:MAG: nicotinate phosphoribosyltransferase [Candidatus Omnitrophica bacterium]|nr:nicotinate phosphoribosyltransferase [Candidatus Omnitrophota bacterium]
MSTMNRSLLVDLYELTMADCYLTYRQHAFATFDLFVRQLPKNRTYLVACGLEDVLSYIENLRFSREDIDYLRKQKLFSKDFLDYLKDFEFSGDIWAVPEGTIVFAQEPILRVTASIIEAQIIESYLLNTVNLQTMIASKAARVVWAAKDKAVYDFSLRRTHGLDAAVKVARSSYIAGVAGTSNVLAGRLYGIPIVGTMAHSFIMSFKQELDSFLAYSHMFPGRTILLVDTYNTKRGIQNAITIGLYLKDRGYRLLGIRLDSGDLVFLSQMARQMLDNAGLNYVKIFASGNLDEFKIEDILKKGACIDSFGVGTNMGTSEDAPYLDIIYKVSEVTDENKRFLPTMKLSKAKVTYPGRKQIFRIQDKKGRFIKDIIGLEKETIRGKPLLIKVIDKGRVIYKNPTLKKIRAGLKKNLDRFPKELKEIRSDYYYPVVISSQLKKLTWGLTMQLKNRQR